MKEKGKGTIHACENAVKDDGVCVKAKNSDKYFTAAKIAYLAMFVAINVIIGAFSPRIGSLKVTLTYTLCYLAGSFYGAIAGGIVAGLGDVIGSIIGGYVPNPIILVASILIGVIPGLVRYIKMKKLGKCEPYVKIIISYLIVFAVCTLFINTYGLYVLGMAKSNSFWVYMGIRASTQSPIVAINLAFTVILYPIFLKIYSFADKNGTRQQF